MGLKLNGERALVTGCNGGEVSGRSVSVIVIAGLWTGSRRP